MLIKSFWELHDPTQRNRQGNDKGNNYRSTLYYTNAEQKAVFKRRIKPQLQYNHGNKCNLKKQYQLQKKEQL